MKGNDIRRTQLKVEQSKRSSKNMGRLYYLELFLKTLNGLYIEKKKTDMKLVNIQSKSIYLVLVIQIVFLKKPKRCGNLEKIRYIIVMD